MKIPLHFIPLQASKNPTRIRRSPNPRRLRKFLLLPRSPKLVVYIPHILPTGQSILSLPKLMHVFALAPLAPGCRIFTQHFSCEGAVAGGILHVYVEVRAAHGDDYVEVYL